MRRTRFFALSSIACFVVLSLALPAAPVRAEDLRHEVIGSDNLHLLAGYYYRNPRRWKEIYRVNRQSVKDPNLIEPGTVLTIPGDGLKTFPERYEEWKAKVNR